MEIVKGLVKAGNYVYLGSRDLGRGAAAVESLGAEFKDQVSNSNLLKETIETIEWG